LKATAASSGGSGIAFDTDNEGDWLYVQANDESAAGGAPHGSTIEFRDRSAGGGITLNTFNGLALIASGTAFMQSTAGRVLIESDAALSSAIELNALLGEINLTGDSVHIQGSGGLAVIDLTAPGNAQLSGNASVDIVSLGDVQLISDTVVRFQLPSGTAALEVRADGTFHILTGASWVADL
jgi:hypothetical protein